MPSKIESADKWGLPLIKPDVLVFDLDGTLADNLPEIFVAFRQTLGALLHRDFSDTEIFDLFGPPPEDIFRKVIPECWADALDMYHANYESLMNVNNFTVAGMQDLLSWLAEHRKKTAVVSGGNERQVRATLNLLGYGDYFDAIRFGSQVWSKEGNIRELLRFWAIQPARASYVTDSPRDVELAIEIGLHPIGAAWGRTTDAGRLRAAGASKVFTTPLGLLESLRQFRH